MANALPRRCPVVSMRVAAGRPARSRAGCRGTDTPESRSPDGDGAAPVLCRVALMIKQRAHSLGWRAGGHVDLWARSLRTGTPSCRPLEGPSASRRRGTPFDGISRCERSASPAQRVGTRRFSSSVQFSTTEMLIAPSEPSWRTWSSGSVRRPVKCHTAIPTFRGVVFPNRTVSSRRPRLRLGDSFTEAAIMPPLRST